MAATIKGTARQTSSAQHVSEGAEVYLRLLRDGTMAFADFKAVSVMAGLGFTMNVQAAMSTGIAVDASNVMDISEPQYLISIPNGTTMIPLRIGHQVQGGTPADGQEVETIIGVDQDSAGAVLTNMTAGTIYNMNTLFGNQSDCSGYYDSTNSITDPVLDIILARAVIEFDIVSTGFAANSMVELLYEPVTPVIINGPRCEIAEDRYIVVKDVKPGIRRWDFLSINPDSDFLTGCICCHGIQNNHVAGL